ncbi:LysR family transcriptional regulator [Acinetobacter gerneri]|uniref:LysR family transcriptional regulator n=1 Tax=Acinetobacter gerneri TaxID=202952 RepID=UPI0028B20F6B|nr:LysR family transcriptional regulator [Acinetobacter gerneri]
MDKLQCMETFVRVAECGSFINAAEQLGITRSLVSTRIKQFEDFVKAPLFHRSTRSVRLSEIGEKYYKECSRLIHQFEHLADEMVQSSDDLQGHLRIYITPAFAINHLGQCLAQFTQQYPCIKLEVIVNETIVDPISAGFDVVFQVFPVKFESMVERKLFNVNRLLCASPDYIAKHGKPQHPDDIYNFEISCYSNFPSKKKVHFLLNEEFHSFSIDTKITSSSTHVLKEYALNGGSYAFLPTMVAYESIIKGELVPVLLDYPLSNYNFRAVFPSNSKNLSKIRVLVDFFAQKFKKIPEWDLDLIQHGYLNKTVLEFH